MINEGKRQISHRIPNNLCADHNPQRQSETSLSVSISEGVNSFQTKTAKGIRADLSVKNLRNNTTARCQGHYPCRGYSSCVVMV